MAKREAYSKLMEEIHAGRFVYTGELEPEKIGDMEEVIEGAKKLVGHVVAANVTDIPQSSGYRRCPTDGSDLILMKKIQKRFDCSRVPYISQGGNNNSFILCKCSFIRWDSSLQGFYKIWDGRPANLP